jgi:hypothetical protein
MPEIALPAFETAPPILFKYRRFDVDGRHLRLITHSELWFACAKDFNDPFDTSFGYNFEGIDSEIGERWARNAVEKFESHLTPPQREERARIRITEIRNDPSYTEQSKREFIETNYNTFGICSLSATKDNLLLWAHYSHNHTGFCVGLSVDYLYEFSKRLVKNNDLLDLYKVNYTNAVPNPNFYESMLKTEEDTESLVPFIATKFNDWRYEQEYRLIFWHNVNKTLSVNHQAISEVILGCKISSRDREAILKACRKYVPHARVYQAEKQEKEFALSMRLITL